MAGKNKYKTVMGIDPSINFLGCSVFKNDKPLTWQLLKPSKVAMDEYVKCVELYNQVFDLVEQHVPDIIVLENPDHWAVAGFQARESGSIQKLTFLCGMLFTLGKVELVYPKKWKGQLPKHVVRNRLQPFFVGGKYFTEKQWEELDHNVMDSLGLCHWKVFGKV